MGYVGILNGMRPGAWSVSIDARDRGGSPFVNFLEILQSTRTPSQHLRLVNIPYFIRLTNRFYITMPFGSG